MVEVFDKGVQLAIKRPEHASTALNSRVLKQMARARDDMRITMAPHLHADRCG